MMHMWQCVPRRKQTLLKSIWLVVAAICAGLVIQALLSDKPQVELQTDTTIHQTLERLGASRTTNSAVAIVVASQASDDLTWLEPFKDWTKAIYTTDDASKGLTVPMDKGREGMVYLTYLIDNYNQLPEIMIFSHSKRYQWHNDDPLYDGQAVLSRLNLTYVRSQGYTSLRCVWVLGCPNEIHPIAEAQLPPPASDENSKHARTGAFYKEAFEHLFPTISVPDVVAAPCCAQFAVTAKQIRQRPKADYERIRKWLLETPLPDSLSGRILEYMWHIIFGKEAISCPVAKDCYCKLFGLCRLKCEGPGQCSAAYTLPTYSTMPDGWPDYDIDHNWQDATAIRLKFETENRGTVPEATT